MHSANVNLAGNGCVLTETFEYSDAYSNENIEDLEKILRKIFETGA